MRLSLTYLGASLTFACLWRASAGRTFRPMSHHDAPATGHGPDHVHGPDCGHEAVTHGDHTDYVVDGRLHHPHGDHCDDHGAASER